LRRVTELSMNIMAILYGKPLYIARYNYLVLVATDQSQLPTPLP